MNDCPICLEVVTCRATPSFWRMRCCGRLIHDDCLCALFSVTKRAHEHRHPSVRDDGQHALRHKCPLCRSVIAERKSHRNAESCANAAAYNRAQRASAHRQARRQANRQTQRHIHRTPRAYMHHAGDDGESDQDYHSHDDSYSDGLDARMRTAGAHVMMEEHEQDYLGYVDYPDDSDIMW